MNKRIAAIGIETVLLTFCICLTIIHAASAVEEATETAAPETTLTIVIESEPEGEQESESAADRKLPVELIVAQNPKKYSYSDMEQDIRAMADRYDGLMKADSLGETADGRQIYHILIGK